MAKSLSSTRVDQQLKVVLEKGPRKREILRLIAKSTGPMGSDEIYNILKMNKSNIIRALNELERRGAIRCVTRRKRDRRFAITKKGEYHLSLVKLTK
ncbi:MAG: ArsR family transcriptional regulator [Nitrososphaera sp.]